jgi:hypothetical protein
MLALIPVLLSVAAAAVSGWNMVTKLRARHGLSDAVASAGPTERTELRRELEEDHIDAVANVIRRHIGDLPEAEQRAAEAALDQPSRAGRASYARGVAARSLRQSEAGQPATL